MELAQLVVFARPPTAGTVKTRLAGLFGDRGAAELYEAFVEDTLRLCSRIRAVGRVDVALWSTDPDDELVSEWAGRLGVTAHLQPAGDLGVKLAAAFDEGLQHYQRVLIIGSDAPTLPIQLIGAAFDSLENAPIVLGPANDGGYYAVGASHSVRPSFIAPWYYIDEPEDLAILRAHLSVDPAAAPATARRLHQLVQAQR